MQVRETVGGDTWDGGVCDSSDSDLDLPEPSWFLQLKRTDEPQAAEPVPETPPELAQASRQQDAAIAQSKRDREKRGQNPEHLRKSKRKSLEAADSAQKRTRQRKPRQLVILTTGLSDSQTRRVQKAVDQAQEHLGVSVELHAQIAEETARELQHYTHVVAAVGRDGRASRTFKYLAGIASGAAVVRPEWLVDSVRRGCVLPESSYQVAGDSAMPMCSLVSPVVRGALFAGYTVYVWGGRWDAGSAHTHGQLLSLIRTLGATVAKRAPRIAALDGPDDEPGARDVRSSAGKIAASVPVKYCGMFEESVQRHRAVILVDQDAIRSTTGTVHALLDSIVRQTQGRCPCRTKSWLFDCISANDVL